MFPSNKKIYYFDYAANAPIYPDVLQSMQDVFLMVGNPISTHTAGRKISYILEKARENIAKCFNVDAVNVIFTSGGTESNNTALVGTFLSQQDKYNKNAIVISEIEHTSVLKVADNLKKRYNATIYYIPVDKYGFIKYDILQDILIKHHNTIGCVSIMHANNEIGTIQDIIKISHLIKQYKNIIFHSDCVQSAGHMIIDMNNFADMITISGHKMGGPHGVGALISKNIDYFSPIMIGGEQEFRKRAGTVNTPSIVGLATACNIIQNTFNNENEKIKKLKEYFINKIYTRIPNITLYGPLDDKILYGHINIGIQDCSSEILISMLDFYGICCSSGSACTSGVFTGSHVIDAIKQDTNNANNNIRISLGRNNTKEDIDYLLNALENIVNQIRIKKYGS